MLFKKIDKFKKRLWKFHYQNAPYIFIAPFLILLLSFYIFPILYSVFLGFTEWGFGGYELAGLKNYIEIFQNKLFFQALWNSTFYVIATLVIVLPLALGTAILLHSAIVKKVGTIIQKLIYLPSIIPVVAIGIIFTLLYEQHSGAFNALLSLINVSKIPWLAAAEVAKWSIVIVIIWRWTGYNTVYYLGGLQGIPSTLYEAADVDGANNLQKFFYITIPMLKPIILFTVVMSIIGSYMLFAEIYILTGGGPADSTISMVQLIYREGFGHFRFGYASAITNILFLVIGIVSMTVMSGFGLWEEWR